MYFTITKNLPFTLRILLSGKIVDIHAADKLGRTTFFITAQNGHEAVARILIEMGAKVTDMYSGIRAYDAARQQGHTEICKMIINFVYE